MKKLAMLFAIIMVMLTFGCDLGGANQSISIRKTESKFKLNASFPERKTERLFRYIKKTLKEDKLFANPAAIKDSDVNLGDTIKFHFKSSPGSIEISFRKMDNTLKGYQKMEEMCNGVKNVL